MSITDWDNPKMVESIKDNHHLYMATGQISKFKTLFEVIKDIVLEDINIVFEKKFISVIKENSNKKSMVHLKLDTEFFEFYHTSNDSITIGVNSINFYKIIKTAKNNDDTITLLVKKNQNNRILTIKIENSEKNTISEDEIIILDFEEDPCVMPDEVEYPGSIITPSKQFQDIFKNIKSKSSKRSNKIVSIEHTGDQLVFKYDGEISKQKNILGYSKILKNGRNLYANIDPKGDNLKSIIDKEYSNQDDANNDDIIQGSYDLDYLIIFAKATNLNTLMLIRIQNDLPLIIEYKVGVLGRLHLLLNPLENDY